MSKLESEKVQQAFSEIYCVSTSPGVFRVSFCLFLNLIGQLYSIIFSVDRLYHQASVLACQVICCLSQVERHEFIFPPEIEKLLGESERSTNVVNGNRSSLREFLEDRL